MNPDVMALLIDLTQNLTLLMALIFIYSLLRPRILALPPQPRGLVEGVLFGVFAVIAMTEPVIFPSGLRIEGRTAILSIATLVGGPLPGAVAGVLVVINRLLIGGSTANLAILNTILTIIVSLLVRRYFLRQQRMLPLHRLLLFGLLMAAVVLLMAAVMLPDGWRQVVDQSFIPVIILIPAEVMLVGMLFGYVERQAVLADALRLSEQRYRSIVTSMHEGLVVRYADARDDAQTNASAERIFEEAINAVTRLEALPPGWRLLHEDGTDLSLDELPSLTVLETGEPQSDGVFGIQKPDGTVYWVIANAHPIFRDGDSKPYGAVTTFFDITEERHAQQRLKEERNLLRTLIDSMPDYIFIKDMEGRYILTNTAHAQAVNLPPQALIGKTAHEVFPPGFADEFTQDDMAVMQNCRSMLNVERTTTSAGGKEITVLTNKIPLLDSAGQCVGLIGISRDITERKQFEQQRLQLVAEQQRIELLQQFINDVFHDFKTPLTIINTSIYLLQKVDDPERRQQHLEKLETQASRLTQLLDDFLTVTHLDNQTYPVRQEPQDMNLLVKMVVDNATLQAFQKKLSLMYEPADQAIYVGGDELMLKRAVTNMLTNALSYTSEGGRVTVRTYSQDSVVVVEVEDTGIGIAPDDLPHVFERLFRADDARSTTTGGTGLGLSIAQKIAETHGGRITAESMPGQGSIFRLVLPPLPGHHGNGD